MAPLITNFPAEPRKRKIFQKTKTKTKTPSRLTSVKVFKHLILIYILFSEIHNGFRFQGRLPAGFPTHESETTSNEYTIFVNTQGKHCIKFCTITYFVQLQWAAFLFFFIFYFLINPNLWTNLYFLFIKWMV